MINKKKLGWSSKFFILIFLYPFISLKIMGISYKISSQAVLNFLETPKVVMANVPEIVVTFGDIDIELKKHWEIGENGEVFLVYEIQGENFSELKNIIFTTDFEKKFDIQKEKSYWSKINSEEKSYFNEEGVAIRDNKKLRIEDNSKKFKFEGEILEGRLVLSLKPDYENFRGEIYKSKTDYSYLDLTESKVDKIAYAPNFYFLNSKDSGVKILRYQAIDRDKDNQIDHSYQMEDLDANVGDLIFYKVKIVNESSETIYNLNITNPIGEHSRLSFGDKLLVGNGYPVVEIERGKFIEITEYPKTSRGGKLEFFLERLEAKKSINIYYCVEIIK